MRRLIFSTFLIKAEQHVIWICSGYPLINFRLIDAYKLPNFDLLITLNTMAYGDFTFDLIEERFGIKNRAGQIFEPVIALAPSDWLEKALITAHELPLRTEKAKSELIVLPILLELRARNDKFFTIYSGENLNAAPESGLNGECDFILTKDVGSVSISYPIVQVVEAKKNDVDVGLPQCAAQLIGARRFNEKKGIHVAKLYGCVTTGDQWLFLCLEHDTLTVSPTSFYLNQLGEILGAFQQIIDYYRQALP